MRINTDEILNKLSICLLAVFFCGAGVVLSFWPIGGVLGDDHEYILQTVSFQNHFSFGLTDDDFKEGVKQFPREAKILRSRYSSYPVADDGLKYGHHFGAYSAVVTPLKIVLLRLGVYPLWAFRIVNIFLWMMAAFCVYFVLRADIRLRFSLLLLLLFNPIFFYTHWTHTELWIFAFAVVGLVFFYNQRYHLAIFSFSIAAMQNLGIMPYDMIIGLAFLGHLFDRQKQQTGTGSPSRFIKDNWRSILFAGVCYIPAFIPLIHTYIHFGTYSLVAREVMESSYLFDKMWAYLFDWNMGIFPFEPFILLAFLFISVRCFRSETRNAILNLIGVGGMLFIVAHEKQVNCAMLGISRYAVWILPSMIFFVIMHWRYGWKKLLALSVMESIFSALIIGWVCVGSGAHHGLYSCWQFAPWTKKIMECVPQFYNPTHGIFYTRALNRETYHSKKPVAYCDPNGYVRKILCSEEAIDKLEHEEYGLIDEKLTQYDFHSLKRSTADEGKYVYFNTSDPLRLMRFYTLGSELSFKKKSYNVDGYDIKGIFRPENNFTWTNGHEVEFTNFYIRDSVDRVQGILRLEGVYNHKQRITILVNNMEVYSDFVKNEQKEITFVYSEMKGQHLMNLKILLPDAVAPAAIQNSKDQRELGVKIQSIVFNKA